MRSLLCLIFFSVLGVSDVATSSGEEVVSRVSGANLGRVWAVSVFVSGVQSSGGVGESSLSSIPAFAGHCVVLFEGYSAPEGRIPEHWGHGVSFGEITFGTRGSYEPETTFGKLLKSVIGEPVARAYEGASPSLSALRFWDLDSARNRLKQGKYRKVWTRNVDPYYIQRVQDLVMFHKRLLLSQYFPEQYSAVYFQKLVDEQDEVKILEQEATKKAEEANRTGLKGLFVGKSRREELQRESARLLEKSAQLRRSRTARIVETQYGKERFLYVDMRDSVDSRREPREFVARIKIDSDKLSITQVGVDSLPPLRQDTKRTIVDVEPEDARRFRRWLAEDIGILANDWLDFVVDYGRGPTPRKAVIDSLMAEFGFGRDAIFPVRSPVLYDVCGGRGRTDKMVFSFNCVTYSDLILSLLNIPTYPRDFLVGDLELSLERLGEDKGYATTPIISGLGRMPTPTNFARRLAGLPSE